MFVESYAVYYCHNFMLGGGGAIFNATRLGDGGDGGLILYIFDVKSKK